jgi:hypothetical protein
MEICIVCFQSRFCQSAHYPVTTKRSMQSSMNKRCRTQCNMILPSSTKRQCSIWEHTVFKRKRPISTIDTDIVESGRNDTKRHRTEYCFLTPGKDLYTADEVRSMLETLDLHYNHRLLMYKQTHEPYTHEMEYIS